MPTRVSAAPLVGVRVYLRPPRPADAVAFMSAARASRDLHGPWTSAPDTRSRVAAYIARFSQLTATSTNVGLLVFRREDAALVGVINLSEIIRGAFCSCFAGYYAFAAQAGRGYMTEGMALALDIAFRRLRLHRVEINVQPANARSIALAERVGFTREGYSRRYLKIAGRWRDHVRYAMLAEDWRSLRVAQRRRWSLRT